VQQRETSACCEVSTEKMPCLNISTNVNLDGVNTSSILSEASSQVAKIIKKPESVRFFPFASDSLMFFLLLQC
jgi:phenylpyruvate tautomerase